MGSTSALGPIGTQVLRKEEDGTLTWYSAHSIIKTYDDLMDKAINTKGHIEPYLQQLSRYNATEVEELRTAEELAQDIAVRWLKAGMMARLSEPRIREKIEVFLQPGVTKAHGRDIYYDEAKKAGLKVQLVRPKEPLWSIVSELCTRADYLASSVACKLVESPDHHFAASPPPEEREA